jgi:hypothetical protein
MLRLIHHGLLMAALAPVWWCHRRVFLAAGISFWKLTSETHGRLHQDLRRVGLRVRLRKMLDRVMPAAMPDQLRP